MDFVGTGRRLAQGDVGDAARAADIETAVLLAFMEVEAAGRGFDNRNRLKMLRETHIFHRELGAGPKRDRAVREGLATPRWVRNYRADSYPDLERMRAIDHNAALRSCSWALGQILGNNCLAAGFPTAEAMVKDALQGERQQLFQIVNFLKAEGIDRLLRGRDFTRAASWADAARRYNGPGYATHNYHGRMATAYRKHKGGEPMRTPSPNTRTPILRRGMKGEAVHNLQTDLAYLGYVFKLGIDGRFGDETDANVRSFQREAGLEADGRVGPKTREALAKAIAEAKEDRTPPPPVWDGQEPETLPAGRQGGKGGLVALILGIIAAGGAALYSFFGG